MSISPQMVKQLREMTGAGMADCKKALEESNGEFDQAIEYLRKKGAASAAKRADREANEGLVIALISSDNKKAVLTEITCETDFVAKNQEFVDYSNLVATTFLNSTAATVDELKANAIEGDTIEGIHNGILAKFSEKIDINRIVKYETTGYVDAYIHGGSKLAVLVDISVSDLTDAAKATVKDIAMQIAAMRPVSVDRSGVPNELLEKEKEIYKEQAMQEGKPEAIATRVAEGRVEKFYKESCLLEQVFVKDSKKTIAEVVADLSKDLGKEVKINRFVRISIGE